MFGRSVINVFSKFMKALRDRIEPGVRVLFVGINPGIRSAMTGHHDAAGTIPGGWAISWNSSHPTRGCDPATIKSTGGDGLYYCFAVN